MQPSSCEAGRLGRTVGGGPQSRPNRFAWVGRGAQGQTTVVFAFAMVALVGFVTLAVEVGNLYAERRQAQSVADAAALAGAQAWQGVVPNVTLKDPEAIRDARRYAISNGYVTDPGANRGVSGEVAVYIPPNTGPFAVSGNDDYLEVQITRNVPSLFAGILGMDSFEVTARAVARAKHTSIGAATISLYEGDASTLNGSTSNTNITGNVYSRGVTKSESGAGLLIVAGRVYARGGTSGFGIEASGGIVTGSANVPDLFDPRWPIPAEAPAGPGGSWMSNQQTVQPDGYVYINPGTYGSISVSAGGAPVRFNSGAYRLTGGGVNINGWAESYGGPIVIILGSGSEFEVQADAYVRFSSSKSQFNGIVIYSMDCGVAVKVAGGSDVTLEGTIYAPCGRVLFRGSSTGTIHGQVVANWIELTGSTGVAVVYDPELTPDTPIAALVE